MPGASVFGQLYGCRVPSLAGGGGYYILRIITGVLSLELDNLRGRIKAYFILSTHKHQEKGMGGIPVDHSAKRVLLLCQAQRSVSVGLARYKLELHADFQLLLELDRRG